MPPERRPDVTGFTESVGDGLAARRYGLALGTCDAGLRPAGAGSVPASRGDADHRRLRKACYAEFMSWGLLRRAAVSIGLMAALLAPFAICLQPSQRAGHSCCAQASETGTTIQKNCCAVRAPLSAVIVAPSVPASAQAVVDPESLSPYEPALPGVFSAPAVNPPQSPPLRASVLRI
jgi:hypothetical protein